MAPITKTLALAGAFFAISGVAAPVAKRAVVWETVTDVVWTTVDVTTTVQPQEFIATATVVPVTSITSEAVVESTPAPKPEEHTSSSSSTTSSSSTQAPPAPEPTQPSTTSSATPAPEPTQAPAPSPPPEPVEPTTTAEPTSTSSAAPSPPPSSGGGSGGSGYTGSCDANSPCTGQMTYYDTATSASAPSACGTTNDGLTELVLALPHGIMTDGDCGKTVTIEYGGVTHKGTVVDKCMGCDNGSIDLSRALFEVFDSLSAGRISDAKWYID